MLNDWDTLLSEIRQFVTERDWDRFHDPKNLAMAVVSEAGELAAELRWIPSHEADAFAQSEQARPQLEAEAADVAITLMMFCDRAGIDLTKAIREKMSKNREKYPVDTHKGRHDAPTQ